MPLSQSVSLASLLAAVGPMASLAGHLMRFLAADYRFTGGRVHRR